MALPKKGLRKITVGNFRYAWSATGNDGWISLSVAPLDNHGQLVTASFDYHSAVTGISESPDGSKITHTKQQLILTPHIVRQVIEYALKEGWHPTKPGLQLNLRNVEDKLDLRLNRQT
jgi:hypothetical protein